MADIKAWYIRESVPETGLRLVSEIFEKVEILRNNPDIGRMVPEFNQAYIRELVHPPFCIGYKREKEQSAFRPESFSTHHFFKYKVSR